MAYFGVATLYLLFATFEIGFHWYAGTQDTPLAHSLKDWYFQQSPAAKFHNMGAVDRILPSILLGLAIGVITSKRPPGRVVWCVLLMSLGIVALYPIYDSLVPGRQPWQWDAVREWLPGLVVAWFFTTVICGIHAVAGRSVLRLVFPRRPAPVAAVRLG